MLLSLLAGLGGMLGWGVYDFFAGVYSKTIGPFKTFYWSQLAGLIFIIFIVFVSNLPFHITFSTLLLVMVASLFYSAGYLCFMRGFEIGNISIIAAINNLWAVFTMLFAFAFMGQRLTLVQLVGVMMIIFGAILTSVKLNDIKTRKQIWLSLGVKETVIGTVFFGLFWNISEILSESIGWFSTTLFVKFFIIIFITLYLLFSNNKISITSCTVREKYMLFFVGFIEAGAVAIVNYGLTVGDAILITPIASALSVVTIGMAIFLLKERVSKMQAGGMLIAVCGIVVTSF